MTRTNPTTLTRLAAQAGLVVASLFICVHALAEKPDWAGGGKGHKQGKDSKHEKNGSAHERDRDQDDQGRERSPSYKNQAPLAVVQGGYFGEPQRVVVRNYYTTYYEGKRCPPGLAKKNNGCMPPGQARKWVVGQPLPREIVYYSLPPAVVVQIGAPPAGYRFVRVASDILLIAIGTGLVIDAVQDLGRIQ